jgi:hypothetical protein
MAECTVNPAGPQPGRTARKQGSTGTAWEATVPVETPRQRVGVGAPWSPQAAWPAGATVAVVAAVPATATTTSISQ